MTPAIKRSLHHDENHDATSSSHTASKLPKASNFKPPAFQPRESAQSVEISRAPFASSLLVQQITVPDDTVIHRPLTHVQPREVYVSMSKMIESEPIFSLANHLPSSNLHMSRGPSGTRKYPMMKTVVHHHHPVRSIHVHHHHQQRRRKRSIGIV